ncbi:MAG: hypothetical protein ACREM2_02985 [Vulcanimicrobiaceae bacterium]
MSDLAEFLAQVRTPVALGAVRDADADAAVALPDALDATLADLARSLARDVQAVGSRVSGVLLIGAGANVRRAAARALSGHLGLRSYAIECSALGDRSLRGELEAALADSTAHAVVLHDAEALRDPELLKTLDRRSGGTIAIATGSEPGLCEGSLGRRFRSRVALDSGALEDLGRPAFARGLRELKRYFAGER